MLPMLVDGRLAFSGEPVLARQHIAVAAMTVIVTEAKTGTGTGTGTRTRVGIGIEYIVVYSHVLMKLI